MFSESGVTLKQLIVDEDNAAYDEERWSLLKWALGLDDGFLSTTIGTKSAEKLLTVAMALEFLLTVITQYLQDILHLANIHCFPINFRII